jgi:hypothetical protein
MKWYERHQYPDELLTPVQKQQNANRRVNAVEMPCPCCQERVSLYGAAGMGSTRKQMDEFDDTPVVRSLHCTKCDAPLKQSPWYEGSVNLPWVWEKA